jgi:hypothetical protein
VTPTTLPATLLPRARGLTGALVAPARPLPPAAAVAALRRALLAGLEEARAGGRGPVRVHGYALRAAGEGTAARADPEREPFRWTARRARRTVGLPAAARVVAGLDRTPAEATARVLEDMAAAGRRGARPGSLAAWLAAPAPGVVPAVLAEATAWATHLTTALDWHRLARAGAGGAEVGGADRWWDLGGRPPVGLRGRADVRVRVAPAGGSGAAGAAGAAGAGPAAPLACLSLVGGRPGPGSRAELGLAALVEVVRRPGGPVPARVVGWWPECGRALVLDVDEALLASTVSATVAAVREQARGRP